MTMPVIACPFCAAMSFGAPPHGEGQPCPLKVSVDEAYIAKLDAERMAAIRMQHPMSDIAESIRRMTGGDDVEPDEPS